MVGNDFVLICLFHQDYGPLFSQVIASLRSRTAERLFVTANTVQCCKEIPSAAAETDGVWSMTQNKHFAQVCIETKEANAVTRVVISAVT